MAQKDRLFTFRFEILLHHHGDHVQLLLVAAAEQNYSRAEHSTAQRSTAQHSTAQHNTARHNAAQRSTAQHSTAQHSTAQRSTAQHSTEQHSTRRQFVNKSSIAQQRVWPSSSCSWRRQHHILLVRFQPALLVFDSPGVRESCHRTETHERKTKHHRQYLDGTSTSTSTEVAAASTESAQHAAILFDSNECQRLHLS